MQNVNTLCDFVSRHARYLEIVIFVVWYIFMALYLRHIAARDSTSLFFDPDRGFEPIYSKVRQSQADDFIARASIHPPFPRSSGPFALAIGITTVPRNGRDYFRTALGSVLEGLEEAERARIHLTTLIANTDPARHETYNATWLHTLSDRVLTYDEDVDLREKMAHLEVTDTEHRTKPMLDYIHLLKACYDTGADFVLMLEDDVIAADGWYRRAMQAVHKLAYQNQQEETVYIRLFFDSGLLGWNSERWPAHLCFSAAVAVAVFIALRTLRRHSSMCGRFLSPAAFAIIICFCTPMTIGLYYAAGRLTVSPLRHGLVRMNTHGCCSQAFLFPRQRVPELISYYQQRGSGFIDMLTEDYANAQGLARWAVVPSVFQHVGARSSKGDDVSELKWNRSIAQNIWNFEFELYDAGKLRKEHEKVATGVKSRSTWAR